MNVFLVGFVWLVAVCSCLVGLLCVFCSACWFCLLDWLFLGLIEHFFKKKWNTSLCSGLIYCGFYLFLSNVLFGLFFCCLFGWCVFFWLVCFVISLLLVWFGLLIYVCSRFKRCQVCCEPVL